MYIGLKFEQNIKLFRAIGNGDNFRDFRVSDYRPETGFIILKHRSRLQKLVSSDAISETPWHRRRIYIEAKTKVVASVWGAEFIQFLATLALFPRLIWKNRMNSTSLSF